MKTIKVKNLLIGEGKPKICTSLMGATPEELLEQAVKINALPVELIEWRADYFLALEDIPEVISVLKALRDIIGDKALIFTMRTVSEGGQTGISPLGYSQVAQGVIDSGLIDFIDIELFIGDKIAKELCDYAHAKDCLVIMSNHDFHKTPTCEELVLRLRQMQILGADLPKIAVMPNSPRDLLVLLEATVTMKEQYSQTPVITMSMGGQGLISRVSGEVFGSAVTFAAGDVPSAPGQIPLQAMKGILDEIHANL